MDVPNWIQIAARLRAAGSSIACQKYLARDGRLMWEASFHLADGRHYLSRADDITVAFLELKKLVASHTFPSPAAG